MLNEEITLTDIKLPPAEEPLEPIERTPWYLQYNIMGLLSFLALSVGYIAYLASR